MTFTEFIDRIREQCPDFAYVDHVLMSATSYEYPAALIAPVETRGEPPAINIPGAYAQDIGAVVGVYIVMERRQNGVADYGGAELFDKLVASLRAALINWEPDWALGPVTYAGGRMAPYDAGIVTWREDFAVQFEVRYP